MNFFTKIKSILRNDKYFKKVYLFLYKYKAHFIDRLNKKRIYNFVIVYKNKKVISKIFDMGKITRYRSVTFEDKEPETLNWIESFYP